MQRIQPAGASILIRCLSCEFTPSIQLSNDFSIGRCGPNRQGSHSHKSSMTFLACAHSLFCAHGFINVDHRSDPFAHIAVVVTDWRSLAPYIVVRAILLSDSELDLVSRLVPQGTLLGLKHERFVNWMHCVQITEAGVLFARLSCQFFPQRQVTDEFAIWRLDPDTRRHHVLQRLKTFFAQTEGLD